MQTPEATGDDDASRPEAWWGHSAVPTSSVRQPRAPFGRWAWLRTPVLVLLPAIAAYLALGIALWQITADIAWELSYVLIFCLVLLSVRHYGLRASHDALATQNALIQREFVDPTGLELSDDVRRLFAGMISLGAYLSSEPLHDPMHHFTAVREEYIINGADGTYRWDLKGRHLDEAASGEFVFKITGDSPLDADRMAVAIKDRLTGEELEHQILDDQPFIKIVRTELHQALNQGDEFHIAVSIGWPDSFPRTRAQDYVFFMFGQFATGAVDHLVGRVVCDVPLDDFELLTRKDGTVVQTLQRPYVTDAQADFYAVEWSAENAAELFLMRFRKRLQ